MHWGCENRLTGSLSRPVVKGLAYKLVISLALGGIFAWLAARGGVPLLPPLALLKDVSWGFVAAYGVCYALGHLVRALRWRHLIAPSQRMSVRQVLPVNFVGFFAIFIFPLRLGEFARPLVCRARHNIPITVGLGTVFVERVVDGLIASSMVVWALSALPRQVTDDPIALAMPFYAWTAAGAFSVAFCLMGIFLWQKPLAERMLRLVFGAFSASLADLIGDKLEKLSSGLRSLADWRLSLPFWLESLAYWGLQGAGIWLLARGCGLGLSAGQAAALLGILSLGILLPAGPGLFGNFQLAVVATLHLYVPLHLVAGAGSVFTFLLYVIQAAIIVLAGVIPLYVLRIPLSGLLRAGNTPVQRHEGNAPASF